MGRIFFAILAWFIRFTTLKADSAFTPKPVALADGLWTINRRARLLGLPVPVTSILVRVDSGDLVLIGAPSFFSACQDEIGKLGRIAAVVAPNCFHHLYAPEVVAALGSPSLVVAPGLIERVPTLPPATELVSGTAPSCLSGLETLLFGPALGVTEIIFFHPATRTLIFTDIATNAEGLVFERPLDRWLTRAYGIPPKFGPPRNALLLLRSDREGSARVLRKVLEWPFERIVVAHGTPVEVGAGEVFRRAFSEFL